MRNEGSPSVGGGSPRLDHETLESLAMLGERRGKDLLGQLFGIFVDQGPSGVRSMREALAGLDSDSLRETAHSLKGSYRSLGTPRLADLAEQLENLGRDGFWEGCSELIDDLETEFEATSEELRRLIESRAAGNGNRPDP